MWVAFRDAQDIGAAWNGGNTRAGFPGLGERRREPCALGRGDRDYGLPASSGFVMREQMSLPHSTLVLCSCCIQHWLKW